MSPSEPKNQWIKRLPEIAIIIAWSSGLCGTVWAVASDRSEAFHRLGNLDAQAADHEVRLRAMEKQIDEVATDVKWIRQTLEQQGNRNSAANQSAGGGKP